MLKDFITAVKLLKYNPKVKSHAVFSGIFFVIGLFFELTGKGDSILGVLYLLFPATTFWQSHYTSCMCGLVQSSQAKKKMQTYYPFLLCIPYLLLVYVIVFVYHFYLAKNGMEGFTYSVNYGIQSKYLFFAGAMLGILLIYSVVSYKLFVGSTIVLGIVEISIIFLGLSESQKLISFFGRHFAQSVAFSIIFVVIGCAGAVIMANLLYKKDIDEIAVNGIARSLNK
ncbi:hypothetical protein SAMN02745229_03012 [Butyrivibrio fibrisolvens DSM 3071]|uniref:ABC-2 family transporter protein n=1 Tax=Butyrivibrio fibrisolvens DSM 3071 TaxID=1121131 RepID=A0A1M6ARL7_BUTFI|nr:hypothetical protein [Butyrivibrio fibrisolvens]SHI39110.1 hypothetical protein SAMN02745229_03012 [Butyrivibrio fibrisolvens DSM 3071]